AVDAAVGELEIVVVARRRRAAPPLGRDAPGTGRADDASAEAGTADEAGRVALGEDLQRARRAGRPDHHAAGVERRAVGGGRGGGGGGVGRGGGRGRAAGGAAAGGGESTTPGAPPRPRRRSAPSRASVVASRSGAGPGGANRSSCIGRTRSGTASTVTWMTA